MDELTPEQKKFLLQVVIGIVLVVNVILGVTAHTFVLTELALYVGLMIGVAIKVAIPFVRKLVDGKIETFEFKYLWMMIVTFFYSIPFTFASVQNIDLSGISAGWVLFGAVWLGAGFQWITEEVWRIVKNAKSQFVSFGMVADELTYDELETEVEEPSESEEPELPAISGYEDTDNEEHSSEDITEDLDDLYPDYAHK